MALQHEIEVNGTIYPEAYSRVVHVQTFKEDARIFVNTYENKDIRDQELADPSVQPIHQKEYTVALADMEGAQFPKAYEYLKLQPEFSGAIDC